MFNLRGDCVYTVSKEIDFATNFVSGQYNASGLGNAFRAAVAAPDALHTIDFAPYEPSHGELASFVSTGVKTAEGIVFGVVALQVPFGVTVKLDSTGDRIESCADVSSLHIILLGLSDFCTNPNQHTASPPQDARWTSTCFVGTMCSTL